MPWTVVCTAFQATQIVLSRFLKYNLHRSGGGDEAGNAPLLGSSPLSDLGIATLHRPPVGIRSYKCFELEQTESREQTNAREVYFEIGFPRFDTPPSVIGGVRVLHRTR